MKTDHTVMLWTHDLTSLEAPPAAWLEILDEAERAQCRRFFQAKDRLSYAAAHALLRRALCATLDIPPAALIFTRDAMGKPFLATPGIGAFDFSLSHTDGMVAVALSKAGKVGVDVELLNRRSVPAEDFAAYGLSREESACLAATVEPARSETFIQLWTAREAVAKADGRGLSLPFAHIRIDPSVQSATLTEENRPTQRWRLWHERPSPRHCLSLAWPEDSGELTRMSTFIG